LAVVDFLGAREEANKRAKSQKKLFLRFHVFSGMFHSESLAAWSRSVASVYQNQRTLPELVVALSPVFCSTLSPWRPSHHSYFFRGKIQEHFGNHYLQGKQIVTSSLRGQKGLLLF
jgi:hypothetical protein